MADRELRKEILVRAEPAVVWAAWSRPELLVQWFAYEAEWDLRPGGRFRARVGETKDEFISGTFTEVAPPHRLGWKDDSAHPTVVTVEISTAGPGVTRVTVVESGFGSGPEWDQLFKMYDGGWSMGLASLRAHVEDGFNYQERPVFGVACQYGPDGATVTRTTMPWAEAAGLQPGDVVRSVDGLRVGTDSSFFDVGRKLKAHRQVQLSVRRGGEDLTISMLPGDWRDAARVLGGLQEV